MKESRSQICQEQLKAINGSVGAYAPVASLVQHQMTWQCASVGHDEHRALVPQMQKPPPQALVFDPESFRGSPPGVMANADRRKCAPLQLSCPSALPTNKETPFLGAKLLSGSARTLSCR